MIAETRAGGGQSGRPRAGLSRGVAQGGRVSPIAEAGGGGGCAGFVVFVCLL